MTYAKFLRLLPLPLRAAVMAVDGFMRHEGWALSGYIAYAVTLALFPFLILAFAVASVLTTPEDLDALVGLLFEFAPQDVVKDIEPELRNVLSAQRTGLLTFSGLGALWAASSGLEAFRIAFDRAYEIKAPRHFALRRGINLLIVLLGSIVASVLGLALVLAPLAIRLAQSFFELNLPYGLTFARYAIGVASLTTFLFVMHAALPSRSVWTRRLWPGVLATITLWTTAAGAFSHYLATFNPLTATYGGLTGVIVTLLFFFLSGAVIILGAELNAALDAAEKDDVAGA